MSEQLNAKPRTKLGSRPSKYLRMQGQIPCSLQGESQANLDLSVDAAEFARARRHHTHLFDLRVEGGKSEPAMVRELQYDAMGDHIIHVEFLRVVLGQKTETEVELEFTGHPQGGVLNHLITQITISCLPSEIPDSIVVPVGHLEVGDSLHISDVKLPAGAEHVLEAEDVVATVNVVRADAEASDEDDEGEGGVEGGEA